MLQRVAVCCSVLQRVAVRQYLRCHSSAGSVEIEMRRVGKARELADLDLAVFVPHNCLQ